MAKKRRTYQPRVFDGRVNLRGGVSPMEPLT